MNVYQRLQAVRKAVAYIQKDKRVGGGEGGYLAVTHDAVTSLTREHLVTHGILVVPNFVKGSVHLTGTSTKNGVPFIRYEAEYRFDFVNVDDPADKVSVPIEVHAIDQGDKAPGKALSYAKKAVVLKLLEIESGDEEEERPEQQKIKATVIKPTDGAMEGLTVARRNVVMDTGVQVQDYLQEGKDFDAYGLCESITDPDEKVALWGLLSAPYRSRLKAVAQADKQRGAKEWKESVGA